MTRVDHRNVRSLKIFEHFGEEAEIIHRTGHRRRSAKSGTQRGHPHLPGRERIGSAESFLQFGDIFPVLEEFHCGSIQFCTNGGPLIGNHLAAATVGAFFVTATQKHQLATGHR